MSTAILIFPADDSRSKWLVVIEKPPIGEKAYLFRNTRLRDVLSFAHTAYWEPTVRVKSEIATRVWWHVKPVGQIEYIVVVTVLKRGVFIDISLEPPVAPPSPWRQINWAEEK